MVQSDIIASLKTQLEEARNKQQESSKRYSAAKVAMNRARKRRRASELAKADAGQCYDLAITTGQCSLGAEVRSEQCCEYCAGVLNARARVEVCDGEFQDASTKYEQARLQFEQARSAFRKSKGITNALANDLKKAERAFENQAKEERKAKDASIAKYAGVPDEHIDNVLVRKGPSNTLNIYFGGTGKPDGRGHAHYVIDLLRNKVTRKRDLPQIVSAK
jgi:hypothetical protein